MHAPAIASGVQSLRSITARSSSSRVLDLLSIDREAAGDPDHGARPMFVHQVLNRSIIVKHHPRLDEFGPGAPFSPIVTKVIFAFDPDDLDLGGQFLIVGQPDLVDQLSHRLDYTGADLMHDVAMLRLLDRLPTLDPFLLHAAMAAQKLDIASCYFRLSPTDKSEMRDFVARQVETLIELCFNGEKVSPIQAKRLSDLILSEGDSPELAPLRMAIRMEAAQFAQAMFCWKAVLFYRWRARVLAPATRAARRSIDGIDPGRFDLDGARYVRAAVDQLGALISDCERRIAEVFRIYDEVFEALTDQRTPEPFRRFLLDGPRLFARLGERMGRLEQLVSYWTYLFPEQRTRNLSPETVYDRLRNLLSAVLVSPILGARPPPTPQPDLKARAPIWRSEDVEAQPARAR